MSSTTTTQWRAESPRPDAVRPAELILAGAR